MCRHIDKVVEISKRNNLRTAFPISLKFSTLIPCQNAQAGMNQNFQFMTRFTKIIQIFTYLFIIDNLMAITLSFFNFKKYGWFKPWPDTFSRLHQKLIKISFIIFEKMCFKSMKQPENIKLR